MHYVLKRQWGRVIFPIHLFIELMTHADATSNLFLQHMILSLNEHLNDYSNIGDKIKLRVKAQ